MERFSEIYKLTDKRNGRIYIGQHTFEEGRTKDNYFTGGVIPCNIIKKNSEDVFKIDRHNLAKRRITSKNYA